MPARTREGEEREQKRASLHEVLALARQASSRRRCTSRSAPRRAAISPIGGSIRRRSALFGLGYAGARPLRSARRAGGARASSRAQMIEAGMLVHGEDIAVPYDRFRDRVMFPIHDRSGRVVAFGGRALEPGAKAKYLNSPEGELFHKGALLYNHHRARKAAHDAERAGRRRGLCRRDRHDPGRLSPCGRADGHGADRGAMRAALDAWPRSRSCASTATRPGARRPIAPSTSRCR